MKGFLLLLMIAAMTWSAKAQENSRSRETTIRGEVIDTRCYIAGSMGAGRGAEHKECAVMCAKAGVPLGILEESTGTVYFVARLRGLGGANDMLMPFIAENVTAKGRIIERGSARMLLIDSVEKAKQ